MHRVTSAFALASYLAAVLLVPFLHRRHHERHGADHTHTSAGTIYGVVPAGDSHHGRFHEAIDALGLADVAHAGIASVDCALAAYTLAACDGAPAHPGTFGDELLARAEHEPKGPLDPEHGKNSLEHLGAALLRAHRFALAPPARAALQIALFTVEERLDCAPLIVNPPRGPPAIALQRC